MVTTPLQTTVILSGAQLPTGPLGVTGAIPQVPDRPRISGFEVGEPLGEGGMGIVFRARELATARDVAVKWLPARAGEDLRKRFEREARAAAAVRHPNIVPILSAGSTAEGAYIVMELVDGFSLESALRARALGRNALLDVLAKVARALHAAHEGGVIHRDVKPANIVVDATGEPRLLDFGLARLMMPLGGDGRLTGPNMVLGTVGYMAPEVVAGGGAEAGPPCDVFALGAILHEGLAGEPAFGAGSTRSVLQRQQNGALSAIPEGTPGELVALAREALDADPAKRPTALAFAERLATAHRSAAAPAAPEAPRVAPQAARSSSLLAFALVGFAGIVVGGVLASGAIKARARKQAEQQTQQQTAPAPAPPATPAAPAAPPSVERSRRMTAAELDAAFDEAMGALAREDRAKGDAIARDALERAPDGARLGRFHALLARDALLDLRTAEAQREYGIALDSEPGHLPALFGSYATALVEGDLLLATRRFKELEDKGGSPHLNAARALAALAKGVAPRIQVGIIQSTRVDPSLTKAVVEQLLARQKK